MGHPSVHGSTPIAAMMGDMGWTDIHIKQSLCKIRFWNRMIDMDYTRITKRIFLWDYTQQSGIWSNDMWTLFSSIDNSHVYNELLKCDIKDMEVKLMQNYITQWKGTIDKLPKLRTFILFKNVYRPEPYIKMKISRRRRSLISQFRFGILPLEVETGRCAPIYDKSI